MNRQRGFAIGLMMYGVIALALVSAIGYGVYRYNEMVRADLRLEFADELRAAMGCGSVDECKLMVDGMGQQIAQQNAAVQSWQRFANTRRTEAAAAEAASKAEIAKLAGAYQSLMAQQPTVKGDSCASACVLLRSQPLL